MCSLQLVQPFVCIVGVCSVVEQQSVK